MVAPPYPVMMVQSESNFSYDFSVESNIAGHKLLRTEIGITFVPASMSVLHLTST